MMLLSEIIKYTDNSWNFRFHTQSLRNCNFSHTYSIFKFLDVLKSYDSDSFISDTFDATHPRNRAEYYR